MKQNDVFVIGTIVRIKNSKRELMIVQKYVLHNENNKQVIYDYGACLFPEGIIGNSLFYFNHSDIEEVLYKGMSNEKDKIYNEIMTTYIEEKHIPHGEGNEAGIAK